MKKSRFLTFLFSFIPGCGLMYLGYMKRGLQYMLMFSLSIACMAFFISFYWMDIFAIPFIIAMIVIWLYQFFFSMHTVSRMNLNGILEPDDDGFDILNGVAAPFTKGLASNRAVHKAIAAILIFIGAFTMVFHAIPNLLPSNAYYEVFYRMQNMVMPALVAVGLIAGGIKLLIGNKSGKK